MNLRSVLCALLALIPAVTYAQSSAPYCALPGEVVASDATSDATDPIVGVAPYPVPGSDVLDVSIAELPNDSGEQKVYFTLKVNSATPQFLPGTSYQVKFMLQDGVDRFVLFNPYPSPAPVATVFTGFDLMFAHGHNQQGAAGTEFSIDGAADAESTATPDGTITIVLSEKQLRQLQPGEILTNLGGIAQFNGTVVTSDLDASDAPGTYELKGNASCKAKSAVVEGRAVEDKSATNFGGAFGLLNLLLMLPAAALRRRFAAAALALVAPMAHADVCVAPGDIVLEDPAGDQALQEVIPVPGGTFYDLVALSVAAPPAAPGEDRKITFTIDLTAQQPTPVMIPGTAIYTSFIDSRQTVRGVRVQATQDGGMEFFSYVAGGAGTDGTIFDGRFVEAGSEKPAEPESSYAGGVATLVVKLKDIRLDEDGGVISGFNAGTTQAVSPNGMSVAATVLDGMPDGLAYINPLEIPKCSGKSADVKVAVEDKSTTNFGGVFAPGLLMLLFGLAGMRRRG